MRRVRFGSVPVGTWCRLGHCFGVKIDPIPDDESGAFYQRHNTEFEGWNFRCRFLGKGEEYLFYLRPGQRVTVLRQEAKETDNV